MKKWLKRIVIVLLILILSVVAFAGWLVGTRSGGQFLVNTALPYATPYFPANMQLHTEGIIVDTLADLRIARLTLSDAEGVWLEIHELRLLWSPFALTGGAFMSETLSAEKVILSRTPLPLGDSPELPLQEQIASTLQTLKDLPQTLAGLQIPPVRIGTLSIPHLEAQLGMEGLPTLVSITGEVEMASLPFNAEIRMESKEGVFATASLGVSGTPESPNVILQWREQEGGILGNSLGFQPTFSHITVAAGLNSQGVNLEGAIDAGERPFLSLQGKGNAFTITIPTPEISSYLAGFTAPLTLKGSVTNDGDNAALSLNAETARYTPAEGTTLADVAVTASAAIRDTAAPFVLDAGLNARLTSGESIQDLPVSLAVKGSGDEEAWTFEQLAVKAGASTLESTASFDIASGAAELDGDVDVYLPLNATENPAQRIKAHLVAKGTELWGTPQANAEITLQELQAELPEEARQILALPLAITAELAGTDVAFAIKGKHLNGEGKFLGQATAPDAEQIIADVRVSPIETASFTIPDTVSLKARHRVNGSGKAEVNTSGLNLSTGYALKDSDVNLSPIILTGGDTLSLKGNVKFNTETALASGKLSGFIRSLEPLGKLGLTLPALTAEKGALTVNLSAPNKTQKIALTLDSGAFTLDSLAAENLKAKADVSIPAKGDMTMDAKLDVAKLASPVAVESLSVTAKGTTANLTITADAKQIAGDYDLDSELALALGEAIKVTLNALDVKWDKHLLALAAPSTLEMKGDNIRFSKTELRLDGNTPITAEATLGKENVNAALNAKDLPFSALPVDSLAQTSGTLDIAFNLQGAAAAPVAEFSITANDLNQNYPHAAKGFRTNPVDAKLAGRIADGRLAATLNGSAEGGESKLDGSVSMPFTLSLVPGKYDIAPGETLEASLKADLILAPFLPLFLPDGIYGNGHLIADLSAKGRLDDLETYGKIDLHSGHIEVLATGTVLKDLTLIANASNDRLTITEGSATDGDKGRITFGGFAELTPEMPVDVKVSIREATLMRHQNANATLNGDLTLKGNSASSLFSGELDILRARLSVAGEGAQSSIPEIPVKEVASLEDPIVPDPPKPEDPLGKGAPQTDFSDNLALKLRIKADNQIFIEGFGLDAELKTNIFVSGTAMQPVIGGKLETLRGRWEFVGRSFTITRGEATLRREFITSPLLNIEAEAPAGDATAIATIRGSATEPVITFSSIPSLPQDEILSRVMFGKNLNNISPFQAIELAQMLRSLSGKGGGIGIFSKLKDTIGIDDLTIGGSGDNGEDMTVGVGKHITDKAYLGVEGGAGENSGKVSLEVDLTP
ncbi:MAG: hypothetical protein FJX23_05030, partial [Alphaproteobacteria bacterium]|nr:hypothetical protein [Alphaproteobacteria bacterium]